MKNKILLFLSLLFLTAQLRAQKITASDDISIRNDLGYQVLGKMKDHILLFRDRTTSFEIQAFNEKMRATWTKEIELDKRRPRVIDVVADKESFCVFYLFKRKGETILKAHKYDPEVNLIDSVIVKNFEHVFYTPDLQTLPSEDESKIVFYEVENQTEVSAYSFDIKKMKLLWEKEYKTQETYFGREFREILTDNAGQFYLIFEKDNKRSQLEKHHFEIIRLGVGEQQKYTVGMTKYLRYDIRFEYDNLNQKIVAGGLYSDDNMAWANGFFTTSFVPGVDEEPVLNYHPFDDEFVFSLMEKADKPQKVKKNRGINESSIQELVLRRDGGLLIIGEQNRHLNRGFGDGRGGIASAYSTNNGRYITDYYYDDLFVISVHPDGKLHWKDVLHKKQYSQDDDAIYSSYFLAKTPSALRLLFNDEIQYENTVSEYIIRGNGEYKRNSVMSTENQKLRLRFRDALQIASNELIVPSEARSRLKLVHIVY